MLIAFSLILLLLSVFLGSPVVALGLGISLSIIFNVHQDFYTKKIGTRLLQTGIILMGLSINFVDALTVTKIYLPAISIFVLLVFVLGLIIGKIIGIDKRFSLLIAAGTAICGGTAMAAITPIIKAKPEDLAAGISIIFILN
ncbi:MAG TPA: putative sulfate exporter family transporter, partial [Phycisphaerales bacterium]|nr:putative sulfate exporter family transporter [Phycisphaerales bacterium]